jgi:hypothetical protein
VRARFLRITAVEILNNLTGMLQVLSRFFSQIIISSPFDSIFQTGASSATSFPARIQDIFHQPFF